MIRFSFVDQFCGGGGFTEGLKAALLELMLEPAEHDLAVLNHWGPAIETHAANHPHARHHKANVYRLNPKKAVPQGRVDLMTASPTCTFFSTSRGGKPVSWDQRWGRMTPWQVYRWCKELDVRVLVVENVPEIKAWGPVCNVYATLRRGKVVRSRRCAHGFTPPTPAKWPKTANGRPVKRVICGKRLPGYVDAKGEGCHFKRWVARLRSLGYTLDYRVLNAADYGDATTRRRFFMIARKDGLPIEWPTPTHSETGSGDLFGGGQKKWRAAAECIDWNIRGQSIFDRERPLSMKTIARILVGAEKCGWPDAFLVVLRNHMNGRPLTEGLPSVTAGGNHMGLAEVRFGKIAEGPDAARIAAAVKMQDNIDRGTPLEEGVPAELRDPALVFQVNQGRDRARNIRDANAQPLQTVVTGATTSGIGYVAEPLVLGQHGGATARPATKPAPTPTTDGAIAVIAPYYSNSTTQPVTKPMPTATTKDRFGLVTPVTHTDPSDRTRSTDRPFPSVTGAQRGELAFITPAFGERKTQKPRTHSTRKPMPTLCAKGRLYLVQQQLRELGIDILFRMLEPKELAAAMGFPASYKWPCNKTKTTRMIGNAVAVNMAKALLLPIVRSLFHERVHVARKAPRKAVSA